MWGLGIGAWACSLGHMGHGMGDSMSAFERVVLVVGTSAHPRMGSDSS